MAASNDTLTRRLMTVGDLHMLHEWLNRLHFVEWWGGDEERQTLEEVVQSYHLDVLAKESVTPCIALLGGEPFGYAQSYIQLGSGRGW